VNENERVRKSVDAILTEICQRYAALGIPVDEEVLEARQIIDRIDLHHKAAKAKQWSNRWPNI
jgi:hypothetical protein